MIPSFCLPCLFLFAAWSKSTVAVKPVPVMKPVQTFFGIPPPLRNGSRITTTESSVRSITELPDTWTLEATVPSGMMFASTTPFTSHQLRKQRPTTRVFSTTERTIHTLAKPRRRPFPRFFVKNTTREHHGVAESFPTLVRQKEDNKPSELATAIEKAVREMDPKSPMGKMMPEIASFFGVSGQPPNRPRNNSSFHDSETHSLTEHSTCRKSEMRHLANFGNNLMRLIAFLVHSNRNQTDTQ